jgi:hypothetical protein
VKGCFVWGRGGLTGSAGCGAAARGRVIS